VHAPVELPDALLRQLELLAGRQGETPAELIRRLVEDYVASTQPVATRALDVPLPLIPAFETGPIQPDPAHHR